VSKVVLAENIIDSRQNVTGGGNGQFFVDSRSRLHNAVKNFFSLASMPFFNEKGSYAACSVGSFVFVASGMSALASNR
jgi:hypothetical protein